MSQEGVTVVLTMVILFSAMATVLMLPTHVTPNVPGKRPITNSLRTSVEPDQKSNPHSFPPFVNRTLDLANSTSVSGNSAPEYLVPVGCALSSGDTVMTSATTDPTGGGASRVEGLNTSTGKELNWSTLPYHPANEASYPARGLAYVSMVTTGNSIAVYSESNGTLLQMIPGGNFPMGMDIVPSKNLLFVADDAVSGSVELVRLDTGSLVGSISTNEGASEVAYDPANGSVFVSYDVPSGVLSGKQIDEYNVTTGSMIKSFPEPTSGARLIFNPARGEVAVLLGSNLSFINVSRQAVVSNITISGGPLGLALDRPFNLLVVSLSNGSLLELNASTDSAIGYLTLDDISNSGSLDVDEQTGLLCVVTNHEVLKVDLSKRSIDSRIFVGFAPVSIAYDDVNGMLYVSDQSRTVTSVNPVSGSLGPLISPCTDPAIVAGNIPMLFDPSNGFLYLSCLSNEIVVLNITAWAPADIIHLPSVDVPTSMTYDSAHHEVDVLDSPPFGQWGNLTAINDTTQLSDWTVAVGKVPSQVSLNPSKDLAYVANHDSEDIDIVNTSTHQVTNSIRLVHADPLGLATAVTSTFIGVTTQGGNASVAQNFTVINATTLQVVGSDSTANTTSWVIYDPVGGLFWTTEPNSDAVDALAPQSLTVTRLVVGRYPMQIAVDSSSQSLFISDFGNSGISVITTGFGGSTPTLTSASISPISATLLTNGTQPFTATPNCAGGPCPSGVTYSWSLANNLGHLNSTLGNPVVFVSGSATGNDTLFLNATLNGITKPATPATVKVTSSPSSILTGVKVSPSSPSVTVNGTQVLTAISSCASTCPGGITYVWALNNTLAGVNPATGSTTTFTAGAAPGFVLLTVMASLNGITKWANATVTITPIVPILSSVSVSPPSITVGVGNSTSFTAHPNCTGGSCPSGTTYSWVLNNTALGTISPTIGPTETFTAGNIAGSVSLYATASLNGMQQTGLALINITKGTVPVVTGLTLTPSPTVTVQLGKTITFNTAATCNVSPCPSGIAYTWVLNNTLGNLSTTSGSSVVFRAGTSAGATSLGVTAQLNGGSKVATSDITLTTSAVPVITGVTIAPSTATVHVNQGQGFTVNATCSPGPCPRSTTYAWTLNNSLGSVNPSTGTSTQFTAGSSAGLISLRVNATFNGKTVTDSVGITITQATHPPGNNTAPPTFLGLPGYDGYIFLVVIAAVAVAVAVIALTCRKKAKAAPSPSGEFQSDGYGGHSLDPPGQ